MKNTAAELLAVAGIRARPKSREEELQHYSIFPAHVGRGGSGPRGLGGKMSAAMQEAMRHDLVRYQLGIGEEGVHKACDVAMVRGRSPTNKKNPKMNPANSDKNCVASPLLDFPHYISIHRVPLCSDTRYPPAYREGDHTQPHNTSHSVNTIAGPGDRGGHDRAAWRQGSVVAIVLDAPQDVPSARRPPRLGGAIASRRGEGWGRNGAGVGGAVREAQGERRADAQGHRCGERRGQDGASGCPGDRGTHGAVPPQRP